MKTPDAPSSPALPPAVEQAVSAWHSTTVQTLGPMIDTPAYNALTGAIANLREVLTAALAAS